MRFIHISDLHLGKNIYKHSLLEDQKYILFQQIIPIVDQKKPDAILLSGDIFDTYQPPLEALKLYGDFLLELKKKNVVIYAIAGNHDHRVKIEQYKDFLKFGGYFISGKYRDGIDKATFKDEYGNVNIYLLPYIHPDMVEDSLKSDEDSSYPFGECIQNILAKEKIDFKERNIILSHQMVTGAIKDFSDSKTFGLKRGMTDTDLVPLNLYDSFDYVALGHIHRTMIFDSGRVIYPGALLPYHVDESNDRYVSYVELGKKGELKQEFIPIYPLHKIIKLKGSYEEMLTAPSIDDQFVSITLTGEVNDPQASIRLGAKYPLLLIVRREEVLKEESDENYSFVPEKNKLEVIGDFYKKVTNTEFTKDEEAVIKEVINEMEGVL